MTGFTAFELAALHAIFSETLDLSEALQRQLRFAHVIKRQNSGGGFFTDIAVAEEAPAIACQRVLGDKVYADVEGLRHGFGLLLFMEAGKLALLEGYAVGPENTLPLDLEQLTFEILSEPANL